jgi:hypothetical protein
MTIFRGAPFDKNNLFNRAAVDGGTLVYGNDTSFSMIEGGSFTQSQPYQSKALPHTFLILTTDLSVQSKGVKVWQN